MDLLGNIPCFIASRTGKSTTSTFWTVGLGSRGILHDGSWIHRLCPAVSLCPRHGYFRDTRQKQPRLSTAGLSPGGQNHGPAVRPNDPAARNQNGAAISVAPAPHQLRGPRYRYALGLFVPQLHAVRVELKCNSIAVAGRANCSSNGSSRSYASNGLLAISSLRSTPRFGSPCALCAGGHRQKATPLTPILFRSLHLYKA